MSAPNEATARQIAAADPRGSTWLSANAGSGKTRVLTDRVARLLLDAVEPQNILCLTYTKAAASEMQNRLFRRLGGWAMLGDNDLRAELDALGVTAAADQLPRARQLFARAIETPGGLKIQTIHSFCSSLLRRFPLEAGISPQFTEMEDRASELLRAEVLDALILGPNGPQFDALAAQYTGDKIDPLLRAIASHREAFLEPPDWAAIAAQIGTTSEAAPERMIWPFLTRVQSLIGCLVTGLADGGSNDQRDAAKLEPLTRRPLSGLDDFLTFANVVLTGPKTKEPFSAKIGTFPTKKVREDHPDLMARLEPLMHEAEALREPVLAAQTLAQTRALYAFGAAFVPALEARKQQLGVLDFDDLIHKARTLLSDRAVAQWVLYRLDGGIDHILVDEAQDTSPDQWAVIRLLSAEMTSGDGARAGRHRSLFVVGDKKQSIYSFQGADPDEFDRMQAHFEAALAPFDQPLRSLELLHSFRSSGAVLRAVDATFTGPARVGLGDHVTHRAFHEALPGRVDLWPTLLPEEAESPEFDWTDPVDRVSPSDPRVQLAEKIATRIRQMIVSETIPVQSGGKTARRPVREGDILILVRKRSALFAQIIRALKAEGLAVAGADVLKLGGELAVRDLGALLSFLALPEDSLSLACALRSPLFGWSERDLYELAQGRGAAHLWEALREARDAHPETMAILDDLRGQADFLRPYDLISRVLIRHDGRRRLLARLGNEAEDGIDAMLAQAMAYEKSDVPSLTGFVGWMQTDDVTVKRQLDAASNQIRVMTVHGAKGLEAPVVILPDTARPRRQDRSSLFGAESGPIWRGRAEHRPRKLGALQAERDAAEAREERRLLYVAMTRAETWLLVCAAGDVGKGPQDSWHRMVEAGLNTAGAVPHDGGLRLEAGAWGGLPLMAADAPAEPTPDTPDDPPPPAPSRPEPAPAALSPSDLGGAKVLPEAFSGDDADEPEAAKARGTALHLALERLADLPESARAAAAERLVPDSMADLRQVALDLLNDPALCDLFANGLREVPFSATLDGARLNGTVDLLLVEPEKVLVIDYKSNRHVPEAAEAIPEGILRQMGAYGAAMSQIFNGRKIELAVLWTTTGQLMPVPGALAADALARRSAP